MSKMDINRFYTKSANVRHIYIYIAQEIIHGMWVIKYLNTKYKQFFSMLSTLPNYTCVMLCYAKSLQSCLTLCNPIDGSHQAPPSLGFSRQKHWSGLPFPSPMHESEKWKVNAKSLSRVRLLATPWTAAYQAPPSMGFSRQEYWSGVPLPSPTLVLYNHPKVRNKQTKNKTNKRKPS